MYFLKGKEKPIIFASQNNKETKSCQKERFNHLIEKERINTVLWIVCQLGMEKKF